MKLAIALAATKSYMYALPACVRSIATACSHIQKAEFVFSTDSSDKSKEAEELIKVELPSGWKLTTIRHPSIADDEKNYKQDAQLRIALLQGSAFQYVRTRTDADYLLSVESDNILPANAVRVLHWAVSMPAADGSPYYDIAAATYPNHSFLGGFGTPSTPINQDYLPHERKLSARLKLCLDTCKSRIQATTMPDGDKESREKTVSKELARLDRLNKKVEQCPPDGNLWEVIAKHGWRRRGWMEAAYPGIGEGAIVPSDWCGMGCTMMTRKAFMLADFNGYDGKGTQDLFLCWRRWYPAGLRIACVPHIPCDHVKPDGKGGYVHLVAYHETHPEQKGHLRSTAIPWIP